MATDRHVSHIMTKPQQAAAWPFLPDPKMNVAEADKPEVAKSEVNLKAIVKQLIEADGIDEAGLPDGFDEIDPVAFVKELARYRHKALGTPRYKNLIKTYAWSDANNANRLLEIFEKAQPEVTGKVMEQAVKTLQISLDYGVMGSDSFMPKLLPNGAVVIRNHHRVIAIDESPSLRLQVCNTELRAELAQVMRGIDPQAADEEALIEFSIIHRQSDGTFVRTRRLPEQLSDWGQTLVFIGHSIDLSASTLLTDAGIGSVCEHSRTGTAIVRIFADFALVYGTFRADDDYDTIVEEYCEHVFYEIDEPEEVKISQDLGRVKSSVISRTEDRIANSELKRPDSGVMRYYFDHVMLSGTNWQSYASRKAHQVSSFTPFFHESHDQPVHYYAARDPYWTLSEEFEHRLAVVSVPMQAFYDIDDFERNFSDVIESRLFDAIGLPSHQTLLLTEDIDWWQGRDHVHGLDAEESQIWIKSRADDMRQQFNEAMSDDPARDESGLQREILVYGDVQVRLALVFDEKPDYVQLNERMKQMSGQVDGGGNLSVPWVGFCQGYDCGGYDTGNAPVLLTQQELDSDDEDDEDDE